MGFRLVPKSVIYRMTLNGVIALTSA